MFASRCTIGSVPKINSSATENMNWSPSVSGVSSSANILVSSVSVSAYGDMCRVSCAWHILRAISARCPLTNLLAERTIRCDSSFSIDLVAKHSRSSAKRRRNLSIVCLASPRDDCPAMICGQRLQRPGCPKSLRKKASRAFSSTVVAVDAWDMVLLLSMESSESELRARASFVSHVFSLVST